MLKTLPQEELERINTLTIIEAVAYANRLTHRLKRDDCTPEERQNGLELLRRLTLRVRFLKIALEPRYYKTGPIH
jgi:hypothetical protein